MIIVRNIKHYNEILNKISDKKIGFVPTMGALHRGHISLIEKSKSENDITICSIFVNEIQFNKKEDFQKYPRTENQDIKLLENADCDILFYPQKEDIYIDKFNSEILDIEILEGIENEMEGKFRPGHFEGVIKIVKRFFEIIKPSNSYFGEKDFQQYLIIDKYCKIKKIPVNIISCDIYREKNGLAMSSRNMRLTEEQKQRAGIIYETLKEIKTQYLTKEINQLKQIVKKQILIQKDFKLEYIEIVDENKLQLLEEKKSVNVRAFISVYVAGVRLIDNIRLN